MIKVRGFVKRYGDFPAVSGIDMDIEEGDIYGFIGPNGAGKTTTMRFLSTLLEPTRGEAWVNGYSVTRSPAHVKRSIGFMPDRFGVYDGMRVWEFLDFFAVAYGIPKKKRPGIIEDVLVLLDLQGKRDDLVNGLSRGMQQRLCLAKTLVHDPPVLILDEPASGLDPRARVEIKELLRELQRMGKTILISSHILSELADCCNKVGIIEKGKVLASGPVDEIIKSIRRNIIVEVVVSEKAEECEYLLRTSDLIDNIERGGDDFRFEFGGTMKEIVDLHSWLIASGIPVLWFREVRADLEDVFMTITKGEVA